MSGSRLSGVDVEVEGALDRHLDPLAPLEEVRAHAPSLAGAEAAGYLWWITARTLIAGATGFVGGRLAAALARTESPVRCLVRDRSRAQRSRWPVLDLHVGDVTDAASLEGAGQGRRGRLLPRPRDGRRRRVRRARAHRRGELRPAWPSAKGSSGSSTSAGSATRAESEHLRSRHETARVLAAEGPPLTYFRAAMVVGAGSESYRTLRYLVERLPVMIAPSWLRTDTQPIGIDATIEYLRRAPEVPESEGREVQIGGPDVLSYADDAGPDGDRDGASSRGASSRSP